MPCMPPVTVSETVLTVCAMQVSIHVPDNEVHQGSLKAQSYKVQALSSKTL